MTLKDLTFRGVMRRRSPGQASSSISIRPLGGAAALSWRRRSTPCWVSLLRFRLFITAPLGSAGGVRSHVSHAHGFALVRTRLCSMIKRLTKQDFTRGYQFALESLTLPVASSALTYLITVGP